MPVQETCHDTLKACSVAQPVLDGIMEHIPASETKNPRPIAQDQSAYGEKIMDKQDIVNID
jgi:hypothetical protein